MDSFKPESPGVAAHLLHEAQTAHDKDESWEPVWLESLRQEYAEMKKKEAA